MRKVAGRVRVHMQIRSDGAPCGGSKEAQVLPTKLECSTVLHQGVAIAREHSKEESGLVSRVAGE